MYYEELEQFINEELLTEEENLEEEVLNETSKSELVAKSKSSDNYVDQSKGKNRYARRTLSRITSSVKEFNSIDMNKFFNDDILDVNILVHGETNYYHVRLSFSGILDDIADRIKNNNKTFNTSVIKQALSKAFNLGDVYIHCTCPDWKYRHAYWATLKDINAVKNEQPSNGKRIVNPDDTKGPGCKHVMLCLTQNHNWQQLVAQAIYNYTNYIKTNYEDLYGQIIYPKLYGEDYDQETQIGFKNELANLDDTDELDQSNTYARTKNRFKTGNQYRFQKKESPANDDQISFDDTTEENNQPNTDSSEPEESEEPVNN